MGVANGRGYQEVGVARGWNLWVWLVSVVVRRYIIDILIIIITFPTPLVLALFLTVSSLFLRSFLNVFLFLYYTNYDDFECHSVKRPLRYKSQLNLAPR